MQTTNAMQIDPIRDIIVVVVSASNAQAPRSYWLVYAWRSFFVITAHRAMTYQLSGNSDRNLMP